MARKRKSEMGIALPEMNMTPMTDCVFLLLIFFMVTTAFKNPAQLKIHLPLAYNPVKLDKRQLICELNKEGQIALNGMRMKLESLDAYLVSEKQKTGNNTLLIKADLETKHGEVLKIMKIAREVQVETIAMAVDKHK